MGQSNKTGQRNPNNPPNPRNGQSMVPYNPELKYTQADFEHFMVQARRLARAEFMQEIGVTELNSPSTPSSRWFAEGEEPKFPELVNRERGSLCLGDHTDDELAVELFLYGDMSTDDKTRALLSGKPSSIAYLMAGKERIRWLSRHLELSLACEELLSKRLAEYDEKVWGFVVANDEYQGYNPDALRTLALEILPEDFVNRKMEAVIAKLKEEGVMNEQGVIKHLLKLDPPPPIVPFTKEEEDKRAKTKATVEAMAQEIYSEWKDEEGFKPWVEGGNSHKQEEARRIAIGKLTEHIVKNAHVMKTAKENPDAVL